MRALARGADFVMIGRAFHHAVSAFGAKGGDHLIHILRADIVAKMSQPDVDRPDVLTGCLLDRTQPVHEDRHQDRRRPSSPPPRPSPFSG